MKEKIQISYTSFKSCRSEMCLVVEVGGFITISLQGSLLFVPYVTSEEMVKERERTIRNSKEWSESPGKDSGFLVHCLTREEM